MSKDPWEETTLEERAEAERKATKERAFRVNLMKVLSDDAGRDVLWSIVDMCNIFNAPEAHGAELERLVGRQEIGQELMRVIGQLDGRLLGKMIERQYTARLREANA